MLLSVRYRRRMFEPNRKCSFEIDNVAFVILSLLYCRVIGRTQQLVRTYSKTRSRYARLRYEPV